MPQTNYLLDTCIWLWLLNGESPLVEAVLLEQAARLGALWVSPISCWEVAMLVSRQRIHLAQPCRDWVEQALRAPRIQVANFSPKIAVESCFLPGVIHQDPADKIIVATARVLKATL